jgi:hypothetical protein
VRRGTAAFPNPGTSRWQQRIREAEFHAAGAASEPMLSQWRKSSLAKAAPRKSVKPQISVHKNLRRLEH